MNDLSQYLGYEYYYGDFTSTGSKENYDSFVIRLFIANRQIDFTSVVKDLYCYTWKI